MRYIRRALSVQVMRPLSHEFQSAETPHNLSLIFCLKALNHKHDPAWWEDWVSNVQRWKEVRQMFQKGQWWRQNPKQGNHKSHSLSSSKCVSMPSAPGTEQMSRAFRKVLHLFTRQQCPPSSFCGQETHSSQRSSWMRTGRSPSD